MASQKKTEKVKCETFLHVTGHEAIKVFNITEFDDDVDDLDMLERFRQYCEPRTDMTYLRHVFHTTPRKSESIDAYVTEVSNKYE